MIEANPPRARLSQPNLRVQTVDRKLMPPEGLQGEGSVPGFQVKAPAAGFVIWLEPVK